MPDSILHTLNEDHIMVFENFASAQSFFLWSTFVIALIMGAVVNKTGFCTMGAVSDLVNIGDTGRMRAWVFAIAIGVLGVMALEAAGMVNITNTFPAYRQNQLVWVENLLGGLLFGIGMTLASGCGNKTLVRVGGGNIKSIMVLLIIAAIAYFMINPFPGSEKRCSRYFSTIGFARSPPRSAPIKIWARCCLAPTRPPLGALSWAASSAHYC